MFSNYKENKKKVGLKWQDDIFTRKFWKKFDSEEQSNLI